MVLYNSTQHAREWLSRRSTGALFKYFLDHKNDDRARTIPRILRSTEVWFVPVVNLDGYDYTFVSPDTRFWRKNLRDNNGDDAITDVDGVDPNRNWVTKWRFDPEGASDEPSSETYRGTAPGVRARGRGLPRADGAAPGKFQIDYHTYGELILYPEGWQVETPATDDPIYTTLAGRDEANTRSRTTTRTSRPSSTPPTATSTTTPTTRSARSPTPSSCRAATAGRSAARTGRTAPTRRPASPSRTPTRPSRREFQDNLGFALDLARSAQDPDDPVSHIGNRRRALRAHDVRPVLRRPAARRGQREADARRTIRAHWEVVGRPRAAAAACASGRAACATARRASTTTACAPRITTGRSPASACACGSAAAAAGPRARSEYTLVSDTGARALIMAAEDYTGRLEPRERHAVSRAELPRRVRGGAPGARASPTTSTTSTRPGRRRTGSAC